MSPRVVQADAFTDRPFRGNPAAVVVLAAAADERWMQAVAREMNLSETAFLWPETAEGWRLRWFTPAVEVDLCGHATLAAAHVLRTEGHVDGETVLRFHTRSGELQAAWRDGLIWLDFPALPPSRIEPEPALISALGGPDVRWAGRSRYDILLELADEAAVREIRPDPAALRRLDARGVIVTAPSDAPGVDFVSRFFAPAVGVDEDPVTGSAHCVLAPYWTDRFGRAKLVGYQASARGGTVRTELRGDRVALGGTAVTVMRGELV